jgi:hypothetical protein
MLRFVSFVVLFMLVFPGSISADFLRFRLSGLSLQDILDTAPEQIRAGQFIRGLSYGFIDAYFNGITSENAGFLRSIVEIFEPRRLLFIQRYNVNFSSGVRSVGIHLFTPTSEDGQEVIWQGLSVSKPYLRAGNRITVFPAGDTSFTIKVCSLVETRFLYQPWVADYQLKAGSVRESFTREISDGISTIKDLYEFINFFGTYSFNKQLLPIQYILLNPFWIDCTEFSTLALEILRDKGISVKYALGASFPISQKPVVTEHCWIKAIISGEEVDIDPTFGRGIGLASYGGRLPFILLMGQAENLDDLYNFPLSVVHLDGLDDTKYTFDRTSTYSVYKFSGGYQSAGKEQEEEN